MPLELGDELGHESGSVCYDIAADELNPIGDGALVARRDGEARPPRERALEALGDRERGNFCHDASFQERDELEQAAARLERPAKLVEQRGIRPRRESRDVGLACGGVFGERRVDQELEPDVGSGARGAARDSAPIEVAARLPAPITEERVIVECAVRLVVKADPFGDAWARDRGPSQTEHRAKIREHRAEEKCRAFRKAPRHGSMAEKIHPRLCSESAKKRTLVPSARRDNQSRRAAPEARAVRPEVHARPELGAGADAR